MRYIKRTIGGKTIYYNDKENIQAYGKEPKNQARLKTLMDNIDDHEIVDYEGSPEQAAELLAMTKYKEQERLARIV